MIGLPGTGFGQVSDSVQIRTATLIGRVVDTTGAAIADVEVFVTRVNNHTGDSTAIGAATSNKQGNVTLSHLPDGGPYTVTARKIGYGPARGNVQLQAGDTLYVDFELPPYALALAPITVTARRNRYSIVSDDFKPEVYRDALNVLVWRRPDMLGDPEWCPLPDEFGQPTRDRVRIKITDRLLLYSSKMGEMLKDIGKRPWLRELRMNSFDLPDLPYVRQVYVNGLRADVSGDPMRTPAHVLRDIPSEQIAEIRYVDCWNHSMPLGMQYSLFVVLKPPPREVQDSILRGIAQRRQVWDSILRSLGMRDSTSR